MMAQFLGADDDHCFTYDYEHDVDESMEAIAALLLPTLDTDSNSSSSCFNDDVPPHCWPQPGHSSSVTTLLGPAESFEFPVMDLSFPTSDFDPQSHCATPYLTEDLSSLQHGKHSPVMEEEAADVEPAAKKRKASATATAKVTAVEMLMRHSRSVVIHAYSSH